MAKALMIVPGASPEAVAAARARLAASSAPFLHASPLASSPAFATATRAKQIVAEVIEATGIEAGDLFSKTRARKVLDARQKAWARLYDETKLSLPQIARRYGGYHHTTVLHAVRKMGGAVAGVLVKPMTAQAVPATPTTAYK